MFYFVERAFATPWVSHRVITLDRAAGRFVTSILAVRSNRVAVEQLDRYLSVLKSKNAYF
jgi:hypothetical protein